MSKLLFEKFLTNIRENKLISPTDRVLAAVSCGPDSVCMLNLLCTLRKKLGFDLGIAYVNHNLRPSEVKNELKFITKTGTDLRLPVYIRSVKIRRTGAGIEAQARKLRYNSLSEIAAANNYNIIATGHTLDDLAETVLLNIARSTCEEGVGSIPVKRALDGAGITVVRPLLSTGKQEILDYLKNRRIKYCHDSSNLDTNFSRNLIRHRVLPELRKLNPKIREHLASLSRWSEEKESCFESLAQTALKNSCRCNYNYMQYTIDLKKFFKYNSYLRWKLIKNIFSGFGVRDCSKLIDETLRFITSAKNILPLKNILLKKKGSLLVIKKR